MGRRSEMETLVERLPRSPQARERAKVILLTLAGHWSVQHGCDHLGIGRTRFQVLRTRLLDGGTAAVEERPSGRPVEAHRTPSATEAQLRASLRELDAELRRVRAELDVARSGAGPAVDRMLMAKAVRR